MESVSPTEEVTDTEDNEEEDLGVLDDQRSIILHLLSQLKLGMDLTRVKDTSVLRYTHTHTHTHTHRAQHRHTHTSFLTHYTLSHTVPQKLHCIKHSNTFTAG